jgi:hypothetical protein
MNMMKNPKYNTKKIYFRSKNTIIHKNQREFDKTHQKHIENLIHNTKKINLRPENTNV